jgi:hypothetical protein
MALNYDLTKVAADYDDDAVWPITNALIWGTMSVGMNSISEVDWKEFYRRCYMIETIHGSWLNFNGKPRPITPEDVKSHIGLKTNASNLTNAKFKNDIDRRLRYAADTILR